MPWYSSEHLHQIMYIIINLIMKRIFVNHIYSKCIKLITLEQNVNRKSYIWDLYFEAKNWDLNVVMSETVFPNSSTLLNISFLHQLGFWQLAIWLFGQSKYSSESILAVIKRIMVWDYKSNVIFSFLALLVHTRIEN